MKNNRDLRNQIAQILVKNNLRTDQIAIGELVELMSGTLTDTNVDSNSVSELVSQLLLDWWQAYVSQEMIDDHFTCWISEDVDPEEMQNYLDEKITHLTEQVREEERKRIEQVIIKNGKCPSCVADLYPHRNCIMR